ncbi:MAG: YkgJ family cysteine cluster protein [Spirochaetaceae bacterium]|nr:MAG: YkgJ family cysteine cluster protein [Spirochaetaceae bacterium]
MEHDTVYKDGLRFACTRCSLCCRFDSGYVFLTESDIIKLCDGLPMGRKELIDTYCTVVHIGGFTRVSLKEKQNFDCVFWQNGGCSVYEFRPLQCRAYPFWRHNLENRDSWDDVAKECPGINIGRTHSADEIERRLELRATEKFASPE